jgi:hypothetical protein
MFLDVIVIVFVIVIELLVMMMVNMLPIRWLNTTSGNNPRALAK